MDPEYGMPLRSRRLEKLKVFLAKAGLDYDEGISYTVNLLEGDDIAATGSLDGNICKCIAVDPAHQGENLTATVITALRQEAFRRGIRHLFLYTKPKNLRMFEGLGFYKVAETPDTLLMENVRDGVKSFVASLEKPPCGGVIGCVVANCNPFTLGHRYLIETAAKQCDLVHLFILSEDKSRFSADVRMELAKQGVADLKNVVVHPTGDYLISSATFPSYFIKDKDRVPEIRCRLDLEVFCSWFVPPLGITRRFVGSEPLSPVTDIYNQQMMTFLPPRGVEVVRIERREQSGAPISASRVRALLDEGRVDETASLVPPTTFAYLKAHF